MKNIELKISQDEIFEKSRLLRLHEHDPKVTVLPKTESFVLDKTSQKLDKGRFCLYTLNSLKSAKFRKVGLKQRNFVKAYVSALICAFRNGGTGFDLCWQVLYTQHCLTKVGKVCVPQTYSSKTFPESVGNRN